MLDENDHPFVDSMRLLFTVRRPTWRTHGIEDPCMTTHHIHTSQNNTLIAMAPCRRCPIDAFPHDDAGRDARGLAYALAIRAAVMNPKAPWPLLVARRAYSTQRNMDYTAVLLLETIRKALRVPLTHLPRQEAMDALMEALKAESDDGALNFTVMAMVQRALIFNAELTLGAGISAHKVAAVVERWNGELICVEADTCDLERRPRFEWSASDQCMDQLVARGETWDAIWEASGLTRWGFRRAMRRLFPEHMLCFPLQHYLDQGHTLDEQMPWQREGHKGRWVYPQAWRRAA
jgi:hypothetical protein